MTLQNKGLLKPTIQITALSFAGIGLNFFTQLIIAYYFGTTIERDAYFSAIVIPTYLATILTGSIGSIFIPKLIELKNNYPQKETRDFQNAFRKKDSNYYQNK